MCSKPKEHFCFSAEGMRIRMCMNSSTGLWASWAHLELHIVRVGVVVGSKLPKPQWGVPAVHLSFPPLDHLSSSVQCFYIYLLRECAHFRYLTLQGTSI